MENKRDVMKSVVIDACLIYDRKVNRKFKNHVSNLKANMLIEFEMPKIKRLFMRSTHVTVNTVAAATQWQHGYRRML